MNFAIFFYVLWKISLCFGAFLIRIKKVDRRLEKPSCFGDRYSIKALFPINKLSNPSAIHKLAFFRLLKQKAKLFAWVRGSTGRVIYLAIYKCTIKKLFK